MFYYYFRYYNVICTVFGLKKPFIYPHVRNQAFISIWNKVWCLFIVCCAVATHLIAIKFDLQFHIKHNLSEISNINNLIVATIVLFRNIFKEHTYTEIYGVLIKMLNELKISPTRIRLISTKLCILFTLQSIIFVIFISLEMIFDNPPYLIVVRIPLFLAIFHLTTHLYLIVSILKIVNCNMKEMLKTNNIVYDSFVKNKSTRKRSKSILLYLLDFKISFFDVNPNLKLDLKVLCKTYDDLCTCIQLLQKCHGVEVGGLQYINVKK